MFCALGYTFFLQYLISSTRLPSRVGVIILISIMDEMKLGGHLTLPKLYITSKWQTQYMNLGLQPKPGLSTALVGILESQGFQKKCKQLCSGVECSVEMGVLGKGFIIEIQSHLLRGGYIRDYMTAESCLD